MDSPFFMDYKSLQIDFAYLKRMVGNPFTIKTTSTITVCCDDVFNAVVLFEKKRIDLDELLHWADVIRFSEAYDYPDAEDMQEKIATAIDMIQDIELGEISPDFEYINKIKKILMD